MSMSTKLLSWGANSCGQLSHGIQSEQCLYPTEAVTSHPLDDVKVAAGGSHTLVLNSDGSLLGAGSNNNGQLTDLKNNTTIFSKLEALQEFKVISIACGWESSYAVTEGGLVICWGSNKYGQLGISKDKVRLTRKPVVLETCDITQVSAGLRHAAFLSSGGLVFVCGRGNKGQLGVLNNNGGVSGEDIDYPVKVEGLEDVVQVSCGQQHTLALTSGGQLFGWGDNKRGQLGEGPDHFPTPRHLMTLDSRAVIRTGWTHSAVLSEGQVLTWGRNNYCQLGHSMGVDQVITPSLVSGLRGVKQLEMGSEHNLALLDSGEVWSWGWNEHGNCGTGTVDNVLSPRQVAIPHHVTHIAAGGGHCLAVCVL